MSLNNLKKTIIFSSIEKRELIETLIEDQSNCDGKKTSSIIENNLLDGLISKNPQVRFWILSLYQGSSSGEVLSSIFDFNSAGVNWKSYGLSLFPFIEFAIHEQIYIKKYEVDKEPIPHLLNCLDSVKRILEKMKENSLDVESKIKYREALKIIDFFTIQLNDENEKIHFRIYYEFFKKYWDDLKDSTHTFRALCDLAIMQKGWRNVSESRYALTKCLLDLADNWPRKMEK